MSLRAELTAAMGRISTPAKETRDLMVILGEWLGSTNAGNFGPHDTWYVDPTATGLPRDGKTWSRAFITVQAAIDACSDGDWIMLSGSITENVSANDYTAGPNNITIMGDSNCIRRPSWTGAGSAPIVTLNCPGWIFKNIRFVVPVGYAGLYLRMEAGAGGAYQTTIEDCNFTGPAATKAAVELYGAPFGCIVKNCWFDNFPTAGATAIGCSSTSLAAPYRCMFIENRFTECKNVFDMYGSNSCMYLRNIIPGLGTVVATVKRLYINPTVPQSNDNVVFGNLLGGDYSTDADSYVAGVGDCWVGNHAEDIAACPTGMTLGVPTAG